MGIRATGTRDVDTAEGSVAFQTKAAGVFIVPNNLLAEHSIRVLTAARRTSCATFQTAGFPKFIPHSAKIDTQKLSRMSENRCLHSLVASCAASFFMQNVSLKH